ncbi:MAG TPA: secretin N-terminal domain-containing protein [Candidatus Ratteibacteria bacterium]|nr:secretin N-terminal domain-containing protein [Candidatus Ratteibacteria bacterium]
MKKIFLLFIFILSSFFVCADNFVLNFNNVDIQAFIKFVGEFVQENYVIDPTVKGNVTIYSNKPVPVDQIDQIFKTVLSLYGFTVIKKGDISFIIPVSEGKARTGIINIGEVPDDKMGDYIIQIIPLEYYPAQTISQILNPYISKGGQITVDTRTNSLIISDYGENVKKLFEIVKKIDTPAPKGKEEFRIYRLENADSEEIAKILTQILSQKTRVVTRVQTAEVPIQPSVVSAKSTNSLIVHAEPEDFDEIEKIIKSLDVLTNQVLIEALIAEVTYDKAQDIGVEWVAPEAFEVDKYGIAVEGNVGTLQNIETGGLSIGIYKGSYGYPLNIGALIRLYGKDSHFNILSAPQIMTTDNQEATINISENIPYLKETRFVESTSGSTGDTIKSYDYKDVGITLKITPQISQNKYVKLKISQEVTKLIEGGTPEAPATAKRSADTTLIVANNKTVVLGGLIRNDTENSVIKTPFLGDIPLLGKLFRKESEKSTKTNLLIFITPRIISSFEEAEAIKQEKEKIFPKGPDNKNGKN